MENKELHETNEITHSSATSVMDHVLYCNASDWSLDVEDIDIIAFIQQILL